MGRYYPHPAIDCGAAHTPPIGRDIGSLLGPVRGGGVHVHDGLVGTRQHTGSALHLRAEVRRLLDWLGGCHAHGPVKMLLICHLPKKVTQSAFVEDRCRLARFSVVGIRATALRFRPFAPGCSRPWCLSRRGCAGIVGRRPSLKGAY